MMGVLRPCYRWGQLVVEYATVCFRSQEDFEPITEAMNFVSCSSSILNRAVSQRCARSSPAALRG